MQTPAVSNQLIYRLADRPRWRRRAVLLSVGVFFAMCGTAASYWRRPIDLACQTWRAQRACLNYTAPPDGSPSGVPACWQFFYPPPQFDPPVAFMHERMTPSGKRLP